MTAAKIIYALLSADATLLGLLGVSSSTVANKKIYPTIAPQKETAPFIVHSLVSESPDHCAQGTAVRTAYMQIDCWANTPDDAYEIGERVVAVLNGYAGTVGGSQVDNILLENANDTFEPDLDEPLFGRQLEFQIRAV